MGRLLGEPGKLPVCEEPGLISAIIRRDLTTKTSPFPWWQKTKGNMPLEFNAVVVSNI